MMRNLSPNPSSLRGACVDNYLLCESYVFTGDIVVELKKGKDTAVVVSCLGWRTFSKLEVVRFVERHLGRKIESGNYDFLARLPNGMCVRMYCAVSDSLYIVARILPLVDAK